MHYFCCCCCCFTCVLLTFLSSEITFVSAFLTYSYSISWKVVLDDAEVELTRSFYLSEFAKQEVGRYGLDYFVVDGNIRKEDGPYPPHFVLTVSGAQLGLGFCSL